MNLRAWVLLIAAGGFAMMALEVRDLHREVLGEHWQAWIPIVYSALAAFAAVLAIPRTKAHAAFGLMFTAGLGVGLFGSILHSEGSPGRYVELLASGPIVARADEGEEDEGLRGRGEERESESEPPVLAPLGLAGLSAFALAAVLSGKEKLDA